MTGRTRPAQLAGATRRTALAGAGAAGAAVVLEACSSPGARGGSGAGSSAAVADGTVLAAVAHVPVGGSLVVRTGSSGIALARPSSGRVVAHSAVCTHQGCLVAAAGAHLQCPCHGSVFDAATGAVENGPATAALAAVTVHVQGADVVAGSP